MESDNSRPSIVSQIYRTIPEGILKKYEYIMYDKNKVEKSLRQFK